VDLYQLFIHAESFAGAGLIKIHLIHVRKVPERVNYDVENQKNRAENEEKYELSSTVKTS